MKTVAYFAFSFLLLSNPLLLSQEFLPDTVVFGSDSNYPPFEFLNQHGEPAGFHVDLIRAIAEEMGFEVSIKLGVWADIKKELEVTGSVHISDMFYTKARDKTVEYAIPHDAMFDNIYIRKGEEGIFGIKDLAGKKVAVQLSSTLEEYLVSNYPAIQTIPVQTEPGALELLSKSGCDAALVSNIISDEIIPKLKLNNLVRVGQTVIPREIAFVVKEGNYSLLRTLNIGMVRMIENGKLNELKNKWLKQKSTTWFTTKVIILISIVLILILMILIWNMVLRITVKEKTKELEFANSRLNLISGHITSRIDKASTKEQTIELLNLVKETFNVDMCDIRIVIKDELKLMGSVGSRPDGLPESLPVSHGLYKNIFKKKSAIIHKGDHLLRLLRQSDGKDPSDYNVKFFAGAPLMVEDHISGILEIYSEKEMEKLAELDLKHLQIVADKIGMALENIRLFEQNEKQKEILVRQIVAKKQAEGEIKKLNDELEQRVIERTAQLENTNKELESFSYSVSHDLRAPLRAISGFAEIIVRRHQSDLNEEGQRYFRNIVQAGERMGQLIDDLLTYSRLGRAGIQRERIKLDDLLKEIVMRMGSTISKKQGTLVVAEGLPPVMGDRTLLSQIFINLLDNAIKYHRPDTPPQVTVDFRNEDHHVIISVKDRGIGIPIEYQQKIFDIFQRLHPEDEYPGTGVGLSTVKKAAELLGGKIWIESQVGHGSTFFVKLPKD